MNELSREQKLANIALAARLWQERVKPDQVAPQLEYWRLCGEDTCGAIACFGGHVAGWPEFREQGVRRYVELDPGVHDVYRDAPAIARDIWGSSAALWLFGDENLFEPRGGHRADPSYLGRDIPSLSDHDLVPRRLAYAAEQLAHGEQP